MPKGEGALNKLALSFVLLLLMTIVSDLFLVYGAESGSALSMKRVNPATLWVRLPEGQLVGSNSDIWLHKGWVLYKSGNTWTFTIQVEQKSGYLSSYDTHLIIALNDEAYDNLVELVVDGISIPKFAFKFGRPNLYDVMLLSLIHI